MNHVLFQSLGAIPKAESLPSNAPEARSPAAQLPSAAWPAPAKSPPSSSRSARRNLHPEERQAKRKRLSRYCRKRKDKLSFVDLLDLDLSHSSSDENSDECEVDTDEEDDLGIVPAYAASAASFTWPGTDTESSSLPQRIVIDVDEELGLQKSEPRAVKMEILSQANDDNDENKNDDAIDLSMEPPDSRPRRSRNRNRRNRLIPLTPRELGYYQGVVDVSLPEDALVLPPHHVWIRQQLELFSVGNTMDAHTENASVLEQRRMVSPGRVGVRCRHCAWRRNRKQHQPPAEPLGDNSEHSAASWKAPDVVGSGDPTPSSAGSVGVTFTFPNTVYLLYTTCTQKTSSLLAHLEVCPNMPTETRHEYAHLQRQQQHQQQSSTRGRRPGGTMAVSSYYTVSARRMGLIDASTNDGGGIRFGRDLSIAPLPWETVRRRVQVESASSSSSSLATSNAAANISAAPTNAAAGGGGDVARITADDQSERVLAQALMQADDPLILGHSSDKELVSDYIFLAIRQMAICHATQADFSVRGKKSKFLRIGLSGFCCRHCKMVRSFSSAADNLSSAISNSFTTHLLKCPYAKDIPKALATYKRLHTRQMNLLPYGSQRKCFQLLWTRLRSNDKTEEEMAALEPEPANLPPPPPPPPVAAAAATSSTTAPVPGAAAAPATSRRVGNFQTERPLNFPICSDEVTARVLKEAFDGWDPKENDDLLLPEDLALVSDYVFLTLRQMKMAFPDASDQTRMRGRNLGHGTPGLCCIHCDGKDLVTPSGRTFPSAPDNFASALNTSLYNHLKACPYLPAETRHALLAARKIHSPQCSSLRFGSQRRFFTILFSRLRHQSGNAPAGGASTLRSAATTSALEIKFRALGFVSISSGASPDPMFCRYCRMVPVCFRAPNSTVSGTKVLEAAKKHSAVCYQDKCDISVVNALLQKGIADLSDNPEATIASEQFQKFTLAACGGDSELQKAVTASGRFKGENQPILHGGIWHRFSGQRDSGAIMTAFEELCRAHGKGEDVQPSRCTGLEKWLLLVAPAFDEGLLGAKESKNGDTAAQATVFGIGT